MIVFDNFAGSWIVWCIMVFRLTLDPLLETYSRIMFTVIPYINTNPAYSIKINLCFSWNTGNSFLCRVYLDHGPRWAPCITFNHVVRGRFRLDGQYNREWIRWGWQRWVFRRRLDLSIYSKIQTVDDQSIFRSNESTRLQGHYCVFIKPYYALTLK